MPPGAEAYTVLDENGNAVQGFFLVEDASLAKTTTFEDALSVMQNQYSTYTDQMTIILTVVTVSLALFSLIIPIFNYTFLQKEQVEKINSLVTTANKKVEEADKQLLRINI